ncbi:hypothetical protein ACTFIW_005684 [Dictyostelium discoideum]
MVVLVFSQAAFWVFLNDCNEIGSECIVEVVEYFGFPFDSVVATFGVDKGQGLLKIFGSAFSANLHSKSLPFMLIIFLISPNFHQYIFLAWSWSECIEFGVFDYLQVIVDSL